MGLFPTKIVEVDKAKDRGTRRPRWRQTWCQEKRGGVSISPSRLGRAGESRSSRLSPGNWRLLVDAGLPLLRGLRVLEKQEKNPTLKSVIGDLSLAIEGGSTFFRGARATSEDI